MWTFRWAAKDPKLIGEMSLQLLQVFWLRNDRLSIWKLGDQKRDSLKNATCEQRHNHIQSRGQLERLQKEVLLCEGAFASEAISLLIMR